MKSSRSTAVVMLFRWSFALAVLIAPGAVCAATWRATAGTQSTDEGIQALAFLPNGLWVHVGDSITWTFPTPEIHTVTFLEQDTNPEQTDPLAQGSPEGAVPGQRPMTPASTAPSA